MKLLRWGVLAVLGLAWQSALATIQTTEVEYKVEGQVMRGFIAYDDAVKQKRPGVLVVHEWWGMNDYARKRATMLAELGYTAMALDMYGEGKQAHHPEEAGKFATEVKTNLPLSRAKFKAAMELLQSQPSVDPKRIAAIGYCFGGAVVLEMARSGMDLAAVVSFHGSLDAIEPAQPGKVKARVLVAHGADDPFVPQAQIDAFHAEMKAAKVDYEFKAYPGAKHSFTNPDADKYGQEFKLPLAYNAAADKASWDDMQALFAQVFDSKRIK
jgi:dienelactone hydrolase